MTRFGDIPKGIKFAEEESKTLSYWQANDTFRKSLELNKGMPRFSFYDGPPFATGLPHYGHILAGTIKDVVTRWAHQTGHYVERRFGWDTHGLPVEYEIDKENNIKGPKDVLAMGIGAYNAKCRGIVMRYATEWQHTVERMGRWIDFENDYKTLYPTFMESVWWVFSQLFQKGLVYRGVKVMPYSTGCCTPLSNFEAGQNYKNVVDPAAFVAFELVAQPNRFLVIWTTTPWTLPSNLAIAVHPDFDYLVVRCKKTNKELIIMKDRVKELFPKPDDYEQVEEFKGATLKGLEYKPVFPYFERLRAKKAFRVLMGTFITTDQGTGVVHEAPYFGEIDYQTCLENGVVQKDGEVICPVDEEGKFMDVVTDFKGLYVKDADKLILKHLKESGHLVKQTQCSHSYPFCWRSDTPLLYKAVPSWFIRVESLVDRLVKNNEQTYWVPSFVQEKRFANWLKDARDWAVSRNRFWGTPINLWVSDDFDEAICPGSIEELEKLSGRKVTDLHRENVDDIIVTSPTTGRKLKRVTEVFDCWFESGSMPYAQVHYPFENKTEFDSTFPADFISEGIDQTRGWFYTLLVLSTALFDKPPFKNLISSGLVLASDGEKMSKRKKNYPDPLEVVNKYGADALRLYLIDSPVVRGENLRFREEGVEQILKNVMLPWFNAYKFLFENVDLYEKEVNKKVVFRGAGFEDTMDKWIISFTNTLIKTVREEMEKYRLYNVVFPLTSYFETLTNVYIRLNRTRFKSENKDVEDRQMALSTLCHVLVQIVKLMAPFTPFFCEYLWKTLRLFVDDKKESVHFAAIPDVETQFIDEAVERRVAAMRQVIDLTRVIRERKEISVRYPLKELVVVNRDQQFLDDVKSLEPYLVSELNVLTLTASNDKAEYGVKLRANPNFKLLGARLRGDQKKVAEYLKNTVTEAELEKFLETGTLTVHGHDLSSEEVSVTYAHSDNATNDGRQWETNADRQTVVLLDIHQDEELINKGLSRELVNRIQKTRKDAELFHHQKAIAYCSFTPPNGHMASVARQYLDDISRVTGTTVVLDKPIADDVQPKVSADHVIQWANKQFSEELKVKLVVE